MNLNHLPTEEEYQASVMPNTNSFSINRYSAPKYLCPKCKQGGMCRNESAVFCSYPPKYQFVCNNCQHIDYQYA